VRILISAGEASGEMYGAQLIEALGRLFPDTRATGAEAQGARPLPAVCEDGGAAPSHIEFFGVGGAKMRVAGCDLIVDAEELSVVGITEILAHLPKIWGLYHKLITEAERRRPDLALVIDSPAFNWRVAREMKRRGVPVVYYVCPQFWAWRQGRVRYLRKYVDKALVIFPFEERFYRARGVNAEFVGHPLADLPRPRISRDQYAQEHGLRRDKQWITLMPGSRRKEVRMNLGEMLDARERLGDDYEFLLPVAPTLDRRFIQELLFSRAGVRVRARRAVEANRAPAEIHLVPDALPALAHSRAAIVASGTATVEAAMMGTPFVMVYRVTPLTYLLGRWTVKVPHFAMVNLIAGEEVVPELVQGDFTAERVVGEIKKILPGGAPREKMIAGLGRVKALLGASAGPCAPDRAAEAIFDFLRSRAAAARSLAGCAPKRVTTF